MTDQPHLPGGMGLTEWIPGPRTRRVTGAWAFRLALAEGWGSLRRWTRQAGAMVASIWFGVALSITICAVMRGVERDVRVALPREYVPTQIDLDTVMGTLFQGRIALSGLAIAYSALLVGIVAWVAADRRRREVGIKRQFGLSWQEIVWEVWYEGLILCLLGCLLGVLTAIFVCLLVPKASLLSTNMQPLDVLLILAVAIVVDLFVIGVVYEKFAKKASADQDL